MLKAYFNYPNPRVTIHHDPDCGFIQSHQRPNQRYFYINASTMSEIIKLFTARKVRFAPMSGFNDIWLEVEFFNREFELATVRYVQYLIGRRYKPLANAPLKIHCE